MCFHRWCAACSGILPVVSGVHCPCMCQFGPQGPCSGGSVVWGGGGCGRPPPSCLTGRQLGPQEEGAKGTISLRFHLTVTILEKSFGHLCAPFFPVEGMCSRLICDCVRSSCWLVTSEEHGEWGEWVQGGAVFVGDSGIARNSSVQGGAVFVGDSGIARNSSVAPIHPPCWRWQRLRMLSFPDHAVKSAFHRL